MRLISKAEELEYWKKRNVLSQEVLSKIGEINRLMHENKQLKSDAFVLYHETKGMKTFCKELILNVEHQLF